MRENRDRDRRQRRVLYQAARMIQCHFRGYYYRKAAFATSVLVSFLRYFLLFYFIAHVFYY